MHICATAMDQTPESSPREKLHQVDEGATSSRRRTSLRLATTTPHDKATSSSAMIDTSAPPSKKKEEKYMGLGVMVDCKDDQGHWNQGRIIDVNVSARLLKIHYSGWHKRYDNWMPLSSIVAHGSRVKNATLTPQSLKQTNLRSNLFRLNPNYVERNPSKLPAAPLAPSRQLSKESETSAAAPTTLSPQLPVPPVKKAPIRISPRTMIANESKSDDSAPSSSPPAHQSPPRQRKVNTEVKAEPQLADIGESSPLPPARRASRRLLPCIEVPTDPPMDELPVSSVQPAKYSSSGRSSRHARGNAPPVTKPSTAIKLNKSDSPPVVSNALFPTKAATTKSAITAKAKGQTPKKTGEPISSPSKLKGPDATQVIQKSNKRTASGAPVVPLSVPSANPAQDVSKPNKKPRVGAIHESESLVEAASPRSNPVTSDSPIPSKSTLAEIFRNRVRDQQLQPLAFKQRQAPPTQQLAYRGGPPISAKERKQNRASNLMYMEHQEAFLRESIQRWTQVQQDLIKDVTSVVVL